MGDLKMEFFGYRIEKIDRIEEMELEQARETLEKHGFRAVKITTDKTKKVASAKRAAAAKSKATDQKIQNGLNLWRMEASEKPLTAYKLAKLSGVSQNTAKKWMNSKNLDRSLYADIHTQ